MSKRSTYEFTIRISVRAEKAEQVAEVAERVIQASLGDLASLFGTDAEIESSVEIFREIEPEG